MSASNNLLNLSPEEYVSKTNVRKLLEKIVVSLLEKRPQCVEKHIISFLEPNLDEKLNEPQNKSQPSRSLFHQSTQTESFQIESPLTQPVHMEEQKPLSFPTITKPLLRTSKGSQKLPVFNELPAEEISEPVDRPKIRKSSISMFQPLSDLTPPDDLSLFSSSNLISESEPQSLPFPTRHHPLPYQFQGSPSEDDIFYPSSSGGVSPRVLKFPKENRRKAIMPTITTNTQVDIVQVPKDKETFENLLNIFKKIEFFSFLTDDQREQIVGTMVLKTYQPDEVIMRQGDPPDLFYIFQSGQCRVTKMVNGIEKFISTIQAGGYAGELGLISGSPRAATITANTEVTAWTVDKKVYWVLLREIHQKKRETYTEILSKLELLKVLDKYHIWLIIDALHPCDAPAGEVIINQGERGESFYMVIEGECSVSKPLTGNPGEIGVIKAGGYFGERALLLNEPRAATITAKTYCKLVKLDRHTFTRLLKPVIPKLLERIKTLYK